jgi:hypothetical protein
MSMIKLIWDNVYTSAFLMFWKFVKTFSSYRKDRSVTYVLTYIQTWRPNTMAPLDNECFSAGHSANLTRNFQDIHDYRELHKSTESPAMVCKISSRTIHTQTQVSTTRKNFSKPAIIFPGFHHQEECLQASGNL